MHVPNKAPKYMSQILIGLKGEMAHNNRDFWRLEYATCNHRQNIHNGMKIEICNRRKTGHLTNVWKLKQQTLKQPVIEESIIRKTRKYCEVSQK